MKQYTQNHDIRWRSLARTLHALKVRGKACNKHDKWLAEGPEGPAVVTGLCSTMQPLLVLNRRTCLTGEGAIRVANNPSRDIPCVQGPIGDPWVCLHLNPTLDSVWFFCYPQTSHYGFFSWHRVARQFHSSRQRHWMWRLRINPIWKLALVWRKILTNPWSLR